MQRKVDALRHKILIETESEHQKQLIKTDGHVNDANIATYVYASETEAICMRQINHARKTKIYYVYLNRTRYHSSTQRSCEYYFIFIKIVIFCFYVSTLKKNT